MPSENMSVQRLNVGFLPSDLPLSGLITPSGKILTTGKLHQMFSCTYVNVYIRQKKKKYFKRREFSIQKILVTLYNYKIIPCLSTDENRQEKQTPFSSILVFFSSVITIEIDCKKRNICFVKNNPLTYFEDLNAATAL